MREDIITCPDCRKIGVSILDGKITRHEAGLAYVPYKMYQRITKKHGGSVKEMAKRNLCSASGRKI